MDADSPDDAGLDPKTAAVARRVARFILASIESQSTVISKTRLQNAIRDISKEENSERIPFNALMGHVNGILEDVFGYELQRLGTKSEKFIVLNKLQPLSILNELIINRCVKTYNEWLSSGDEYFSLSLDTLDDNLHKQDFAFKGLLSVTLCVVLFSKNHILQQELLKHLGSFGIPVDGSKIPILGCNIDDLLKTFDKREYLTRIQDSSDLQGDSVFYRIGRRTQLEFDLDSLVLLVRTVMGLPEDQHPTLREDISRNIADSYKSSAST